MAKIETVKGFNDFIGEEAKKRAKIRSIIENEFELFGFEPAETPTIEFEDFVRGDNKGDEAVSDIFTLEDKGGRKLALKYENTFQLKRIAKGQKLPYKRYQIARVFRNEPVKRGRLREFTQCDCDIIGSNINDETESIILMKNIFDKINLKTKILVNDRRLLNEIMETENIKEMYREQIIRTIDKLDKISKKDVADILKEWGAEKLIKIFEGNEKSFEKYAYFKEIKKLIKNCAESDVEIIFTPSLARGLSYYNGTILEVRGEGENIGTIAAGGAYMINDIQSFGFSFGLDRISMITERKGNNIEYLLISLEQEKKTITIANKLREAGKRTQVLLDKTLRKAMDYANAKDVENVVIIGEEEVEKKKYKIRNMKTGKEKVVSEDKLIN